MIIQADAKALEWWTAVWLSQDPIGMEEILEGRDLHSENERAFGLPSRLIAKKYLFRTIYRGSAYAFSKDPEFAATNSTVIGNLLEISSSPNTRDWILLTNPGHDWSANVSLSLGLKDGNGTSTWFVISKAT